jgi:hypothetical protein
MHERWLDTYEQAYADPPSVSTMSCPSCGSRSLALTFVVEQRGAFRGMSAFWCSSCLRGLLPNTTTVPEGGLAAVRGSEQIPDYGLIPDDE